MGETLNTVLAVGAILGGVAYAISQIVSSRRRGESDAVALALQELDVLRARGDRLERELVGLQAEVHALKKENAALRDVLTTRNDLDQKLVDTIEAAVQKQTRRLVDVLREGN